MTDYKIRPAADTDKEAVVSIFNYYVETGTAAFPEIKLGAQLFDYLKTMTLGNSFYVIEETNGQIVGFGLLHAFNRFSTFAAAAELSYFIMPEHTAKGLGSLMLEKLISDSRRMGIDNLLAEISSENRESLNFHLKNGFAEAGRLKMVGKKLGRKFDVVWMQRFI